MSEKLKHCPICECADTRMEDIVSSGEWRVRCERCGCQTCWWHSEADARKAWNTRAETGHAEGCPAGDFGPCDCTDLPQTEQVREALEFYADPFAWKKKNDPEDVVRIPDFYSETSFGDTAIEALSALSDDKGAAGTSDLYAWPVGCHDPNSCHRNKQCMYIKCRHEGTDIASLHSRPNCGGQS